MITRWASAWQVMNWYRGTPHEEIVAFARELEKAGVDLINVTGGWHESRVPQITMNVPEGPSSIWLRPLRER